MESCLLLVLNNQLQDFLSTSIYSTFREIMVYFDETIYSIFSKPFLLTSEI